MAKRLVSPDWRTYRVASKEDLTALTVALNIHWKLAGNLRQLLEFDEVGSDRARRHVASGWHLLNEMQWVVDTGSSEVVPLCGTVSEKLKLMQQRDAGIDGLALKKLLNGSRKADVGRWKKLAEMPYIYVDLSDGDSVLGRFLPRAVTQTSHGQSEVSSCCECLECGVGWSLDVFTCMLQFSQATFNLPIAAAIPITSAGFPTAIPITCIATAVPAKALPMAVDAAAFPAEASVCVSATEVERMQASHHAEKEQLREDVARWRNTACNLEDEVQRQSDVLSEALNDQRVELETLTRLSASARNVLAMWDAQKELISEHRARELLELKLRVATARIGVLEAQSKERFGVVDAFTMRSGGLSALQPGAGRLREIADATNTAFVTAMETVLPDDPVGVFQTLMAKPSFRNRFLPKAWRDGLTKKAVQEQLLKSPFVNSFVSVYQTLKGFRRKRQHLSIFAPHFPYKVTTRIFNVGRKLVYLARLHAGEYGGARPVPPSLTSYRISPEAAAGVNAFVSRPEITQVLASAPGPIPSHPIPSHPNPSHLISSHLILISSHRC